MRINHNVPAMNALRLLNVNSSNSSKTLEKLSSGKRINRAGDDAAGMAISEKMRAQVNGLKIASRNSLDGVSLVQTAEGAMAEVHSMLQRMRELSVQSANGTMSKTDRGAIQDEVNQLTSEINRITNGTEYNTRHILKGNEEPKSNTVVQRMTTGDVARVTLDKLSIHSPNEVMTSDFKNKTLTVDINNKKTEVNLQGFGPDNTTLTSSELLIRINDALGDDAVAVFNSDYKIEIRTKLPGGSQNIKLEGSAVPDLFNAGYDTTNNNRVNVYGTAENSGGTAKGAFYMDKAPTEGSFITIGNDRIDFYDSSKAPYVGSNKAIDISAGSSVGQMSIVKQTQVFSPSQPGKFEFDVTKPIGVGDRIIINGIEFKAVAAASVNENEFVVNAAPATTLTNLASKIQNHSKLISVFNGNTPTATAATVAATIASATAADTLAINAGKDNGAIANAVKIEISNTLNSSDAVSATYDSVNKKIVVNFASTTQAKNTSANIQAKINALSSADGIDFSKYTLTGAGGFIGTGATAPSAAITLTLSGGGNDAVKADIVSTPNKITFATKSPTLLTAEMSKTKSPEDIIAEIKNNVQLDSVKFSIDPSNKNKRELLLEARQVGFKGNLISLEGTLEGFNTNLQIGANSGQGFRLEVGDIRSRALRISAEKPTGNPGVTGAAYIKMPNVTDGVSSSMVEYSLDVSDEKLASAAIEVYNNAIVKVASERSRLGATQNRLEHTIANLDNTEENLTAAMSRIEDTDMAEEMANFQKLNVLQQAGVSMLAQANQQPQAILKLLQ